MLISSCSKTHQKKEDRIITDLNEVFDPNHEGDTDWNHTEIDEDLMTDMGLYYDEKIKAYRQKTEDRIEETSPPNPIMGNLISMGLLYIIFEIWLMYATYKVACRRKRIIWLWLINCLMGGIYSFVILCLSKELEYNSELEYREEADLLGITMTLGNIMAFIILYMLSRTFVMIINEPMLLKNLIGI